FWGFFDTHTLWFAVFTIMYMILLYLLSSFQTDRKITKELKILEKKIDKLNSKNYDIDEDNHLFYETGLILDRLNRLGRKLEKRERTYKNHTKTLMIRNRQNNEIISAISHEFKNPISTIMGYCETLIQEDESINSSIRKRFLEKISNSGNKLSLLIDRLSLSINLENRNLEIKKSTFFIKECLKDAISQLSVKYNDRSINISGEDRKVYADRVLLEIVFINLIENALKYSETDIGIEIGVESISVIDSGMGLDEGELENITKKFYRVNKNTWNSSLGLGLFIVKYILELHGSELKIESRPSIGSKFCFNL
ncbi:MAG: sensor histidine kinase, partial [Campylobacterales bacterium]